MIWLLLLAAVGIAGAYFYFNQPDIVHQMGNFWTLAGVGVFMLFMLIGVSYLARSRGARRGSLRLLLILPLFFVFHVASASSVPGVGVVSCASWFPGGNGQPAVQIPVRISIDTGRYNPSNVNILVELYEDGQFLGGVSKQYTEIQYYPNQIILGTTGVSLGWHNYTVKLVITGDLNLSLSWTESVKVGDTSWSCQWHQVYPPVEQLPPYHTSPQIDTNTSSGQGTLDIPNPVDVVRDHPALVGLGLATATLLLLAVKGW